MLHNVGINGLNLDYISIYTTESLQLGTKNICYFLDGSTSPNPNESKMSCFKGSGDYHFNKIAKLSHMS